ncbi:MAG: LuxR C-terminal-related transcriptional regulator [Chloroflexota bacterium]
MTSVFIVAAVPALRAGLRAMLEQGGIEFAGEAQSLADIPAEDSFQGQHGLGRDAGRPRSPAESATVLLVAADLHAEDVPDGRPVVLLSADAREASVLQGLGLRGWALLPPDAGADQLIVAVTAVAQGLVLLPAEMAAAIASTPPVEVSDPLQEPLTPRELEVLQLLSHGLSNKLIARTLSISEHTVKFHVSSTYAKLGAASRTEAVSLAARKGLISL